MAEFQIPSFLLNHSTDDNHELMKSILPADLDISEGSHEWNFTRPTALVIARLCEFVLPEVIKVFSPEWSYGTFLDEHAKTRKMTRRAATAATGSITITGEENTVIPAGSLFATAAINDEPSVDYKTLEKVTIPAEGSVTVNVECTQTGIIGNTLAGTVILVGSRITGIKSVTNAAAITGGTEVESDESLSARIVEYDKTQGESFVGCVADYKRWAMSVPGTGEATVIPAKDTSGLVTIVVTDTNGDPASETLCTAIYDYIMSPNDPSARLAPINAALSVIPPASISFSVKATVELKEGATLEAVIARRNSHIFKMCFCFHLGIASSRFLRFPY